MDLVEKFRRTAHECFRWAQGARTLQDNAMWLSMAQFWLQLARHAEERGERRAGSPAVADKPQREGTGTDTDNAPPSN